MGARGRLAANSHIEDPIVKPTPLTRAFSLGCVLLVTSCARTPTPTVHAAPAGPGPEFGDAFWKHWGDGRGELAGYDLEIPRYGPLRHGVAVTIFVTETFSNSR